MSEAMCPECGGVKNSLATRGVVHRWCDCPDHEEEGNAPPEIRSGEWVAALAKNLYAEGNAMRNRMESAGDKYDVVSLLLWRISFAIERTLESAATDSNSGAAR